MALTTALNTSAVPIACAGGTPRNRVSTGAVMTPPPTPVRPIMIAMPKPIRNSMSAVGGEWFVVRGAGTPRRTLQMDSALQFFPGPSARARIVRVYRKGGARDTTDARIAVIVQREQRDFVLAQVGPDRLCRPIGQRRDFAQVLAGGELEVVDRQKIGARFGLLSPKARKPGVVVLK